MHRATVLWAAFGACVGLTASSPVGAASIVPSPLEILHDGGAQGELRLLEAVAGLPVDGVASLGLVEPAAQTLVFQGRVAAGSPPPGAGLTIRLLDELGDVIPIAAAGFVPGPGSDLLIAASAAGGATFVFATQAPGTVFDAVFLSFDLPLALDGSIFVEAALENGPPGGIATLVPEPGTATLLGLGLSMLVRWRRASRDTKGG